MLMHEIRSQPSSTGGHSEQKQRKLTLHANGKLHFDRKTNPV